MCSSPGQWSPAGSGAPRLRPALCSQQGPGALAARPSYLSPVSKALFVLLPAPLKIQQPLPAPVLTLNHRPTTVCVLVTEPGVGWARQRLLCWLCLADRRGLPLYSPGGRDVPSPLSTLYMFEK